MKMINWYFEGQDIRFVSSEDKLDRHILTNRTRFDAHDKKVIIDHEYFNSDAAPDAPCSTCGATTTPLSTVSVDNKKTKAKQKAVHVLPVHGDVASAGTPTASVEDDPDLSLLNGVSNSVGG